MNTRNALLFLGATTFALPACGDDTGGGTGGGGGDAGTGGSTSSSGGGDAAGTGGGPALECLPDPLANCTDAELQAIADYAECSKTRCGTEGTTAYGPGYPEDATGGACATFQGCLAPCTTTDADGGYCYDTACIQACGAPDAACSEAAQALGTCLTTMCAAPAPCGGS